MVEDGFEAGSHKIAQQRKDTICQIRQIQAKCRFQSVLWNEQQRTAIFWSVECWVDLKQLQIRVESRSKKGEAQPTSSSTTNSIRETWTQTGHQLRCFVGSWRWLQICEASTKNHQQSPQTPSEDNIPGLTMRSSTLRWWPGRRSFVSQSCSKGQRGRPPLLKQSKLNDTKL